MYQKRGPWYLRDPHLCEINVLPKDKNMMDISVPAPQWPSASWKHLRPKINFWKISEAGDSQRLDGHVQKEDGSTSLHLEKAAGRHSFIAEIKDILTNRKFIKTLKAKRKNRPCAHVVEENSTVIQEKGRSCSLLTQGTTHNKLGWFYKMSVNQRKKSPSIWEW